MGRRADQFRQSDLARWGIVAGVSAVLALLAANLSPLLPDALFANLHAARVTAQHLDPATVTSALVGLQREQARLGAADSQFASRVDAAEQATSAMRHEIGKLEASLPRLVSTVPMGGTLDPDATGALDPRPQGFKPTIDAKPPGKDSASAGATAPKPLPPRPELDEQAPQLTAPATQLVPDQTSAPPAAQTAVSAPTGEVGGTSRSPAPPSSTSAALPATADATAAASPSKGAVNPAASDSPLVQAQLAADAADAGGTPSATTAGTAGEIAPAPAGAFTAVAPRVAPTTQTQPAVTASASPVSAGPDKVAMPRAATAPDKPAAGPSTRSVGIAVGSPVQPAGALAAWEGLASKVGVMLVGTSPLLAEDPAGGPGKVLVAGPIPSIAAATTLCANISRAGINCTPMPYVGAPLAPAAPAD